MNTEQLRDLIHNNKIKVADIIEIKIDNNVINSLFVINIIDNDIFVYDYYLEKLDDLICVLKQRHAKEPEYVLYTLINPEKDLHHTMLNFVEAMEYNDYTEYYKRCFHKEEEVNISNFSHEINDYVQSLINEASDKDIRVDITVINPSKMIIELLPF